jgi:hypothetical protein
MSDGTILSPAQKHMLTWIGMTLLRIQSVEKTIQLCVTYVFPKTPIHKLSISALCERTEYLRTKTVGYLLKELRTRVGIDDTFEDVLKKFLKMRNMFIHNVYEITGWSLDSDDGLAIARDFVSELLRLSGIVEGVFVGLTRSWQEENNMELEVAGIPAGFFDKIDAIYKPLVDIIFFEKE